MVSGAEFRGAVLDSGVCNLEIRIMPELALPVGIHLRAQLPARHVFVYGTLRRGDDNDITRLLPSPRFVGDAVISGVMYHLGSYPGVVLGHGSAVSGVMAGAPSGNVIGEVYAIEPELERKLDEIEMIFPQQRDEYFKRHIRVSVGAQSLSCVVYEINPLYAEKKPVIVSGDWVKDRGASRPSLI